MITIFAEYFSAKSLALFSKSALILMPHNNELIEELQQSALFMKQIDLLDPFVPEDFRAYLKENLTKGLIRRDRHFPLYYVGKDATEFSCTAPELLKTIWINFKLTKLWLELLQTDGYFTETSQH